MGGRPYPSEATAVAAPVTSPTIVGRRDELEALVAARRSLAQSQGCAVLIGGEAGIGKSRLLTHFLHDSSAVRARLVATSECLERANHPFGAIRDVVASIYDRLDTSGIPPNALRAVGQLAGPLVTLPKAVTHAAPLETSDLFSALVAFFRFACARRALIVAIEDLHWADRSSLEFLEYFAPRLRGLRLLFVATYRSDEVESTPALLETLSHIERAPGSRMFELSALSPIEVGQLLARVMEGRPPLDVRTCSDIARRCEGNPFFAEELLKSALDRRGASAHVELPRSIRASILRRLGELTHAQRRVLACASVLGYRFDPSVLARVMDGDEAFMLATLHRARDLSLIVDERGPAATCRFRHALTRQTIYEDLLAFDARSLHAKVLATLEALPDADTHLEALAHNAAAANDRDKALAYSERAGDAASALCASFEACEHFERALGLATDAAHRAALYEKLGDTQFRLALNERSCDNFQSAKNLRLQLADFDRAGLLAERAHMTLANDGNITAGIALLEDFLSEYGARTDPNVRAQLRFAQAMCVSNLGEPARMREYVACIDPRMLESDAASLQRLALVESTIAAIEGLRAQWDLAVSHVEGRTSAHQALAQRVGARLSLTGISVGANARAQAWLEFDATHCREHGLMGHLGFDLSLRAMNAYLTGRVAEAYAALREARDHDALFGARYHIALMGPLIGASLGDRALIRTSLDPEMVARFRANGEDVPFVIAAASQAFAEVHDGSQDHARRLFGEIVDRLRVPYYTMFALPLAARYADMAHVEKLRRFCRAYAGSGRPIFAASTAHVEAIAALRLGDTQGARRHASDAAARYRLIGWPLFEAAACELAGEDDDARTLFERCGAVADVRRLTMASTRPAKVSDKRELSVREREIVALVALGLTNAAIAARLFISTKTVEKNLTSIFAKLDVRSRTEIAASVAREESGAAERHATR